MSAFWDILWELLLLRTLCHRLVMFALVVIAPGMQAWIENTRILCQSQLRNVDCGVISVIQKMPSVHSMPLVKRSKPLLSIFVLMNDFIFTHWWNDPSHYSLHSYSWTTLLLPIISPQHGEDGCLQAMGNSFPSCRRHNIWEWCKGN